MSRIGGAQARGLGACGTGRDAVVRRVRKLLALSRGGATEGEATAAVLAAQRLVALWDIDEAELGDTDHGAEPVVAVRTRPLSEARTWRWPLADLVARSFRCRHCYVRARGARHWRFEFYGHEEDAQAARLAFEYLYAIGNRRARRVVRRLSAEGCPVWSGWASDSYLTGFLAGVTGELERQSRELMVVVPSDVREAFEEVSRGFGRVAHHPLSCDPGRYDVIDEGERDGRDAVRSRRVEGRLALG